MAAEKKEDKLGRDIKRANKEILEARIERTIELISLCKPTSEIIRVGKEEWGVGVSAVEKILRAARARIRERWNGQDRQDFVASALEKMEKVAELSIEQRQHSNAIGAVALQAKLLQITNRDN